MRHVKYLFLAFMSIFAWTFQSCDSDEQMNAVEDIALISEQSDVNKDGMFAVNFVNPDGTPYAPDGLTKVTWGGSYSEYPYGTEVTTNWGTFCSKSGDQVTLSGGDGGSATLTGSGQSYTIASGIDKNYTISVTKTSAPEPVTQYTITLNIKTTGIEKSNPAKLNIYNNGDAVYGNTIASGSRSTSFKVDKGSNVSLTANCNYGVTFSDDSFTNVTSNKTVTVWVNF